MNTSITIFENGSNKSSSVELTRVPDTCPVCNNAASLLVHQAHGTKVLLGKPECIQVLLQCPRNACRRLSIGYFKALDSELRSAKFEYILPKVIPPASFSDEISSVSSDFVEIYIQAGKAENESLDKIAGVGYRKALEFLIKDYAIQQNPDKKDEIQNQQLGKCISIYVSDQKIKTVSKRAAWLGNDETHYVRLWESKDINDLKMLINLTVYWIESEILTAKLIEDMPDSGPEPATPDEPAES